MPSPLVRRRLPLDNKSMNTLKLLSLASLSSVISFSVFACPETCSSTIEGDQLESSVLTLPEHTPEPVWQVLRKALEAYEIHCQSPTEQRILIACAPDSPNKVLIWIEEPRVDEGAFPRSTIHFLSACAPHENVTIKDLQNDILDAVDAVSKDRR